MAEQRPFGAPSFVIVVSVVVLLVATGFTLLHWHKDWADKGCQLCHIRHLPSLYSSISVACSSFALSDQDWSRDYSGEELDTCVRNSSSRSPPAYFPSL